jgi:hypothetical protein
MSPEHVSSTSVGNVGNALEGDHVSMNNTGDNMVDVLFAARGVV